MFMTTLISVTQVHSSVHDDNNKLSWFSSAIYGCQHRSSICQIYLCFHGTIKFMVQFMFMYIMRSTSSLTILHQYKPVIIHHQNPLGSVEGSNTIPSLPVNLDSDAKHSVQDINSPEKNAAPVQKQKETKE
ncbi:hypothetical protein ACJX0J_018177 [Zea mays]